MLDVIRCMYSPIHPSTYIDIFPIKESIHTDPNAWLSPAILQDDLESWLSAMRVGLQAKFGNAPARTEDAQGRPFQQPHKRDGTVCGVSGQPFNRSNPKCVCVSCGGVFGSEYCCEDIPLLHYKMQTGSRVCRNCFLAQYFLNHLKLLNSTLRTHLHEVDLEGKEVTDKNSAKIRVFRRSSKEAHIAWELYESNQIDGKEFNELLKADLRMKEEREKAVLVEFQQDLDLAGEDAIVLLRYLFDFRDEGQPQKYILILKVRVLFKNCLELVLGEIFGWK